MQCQDCGEQKRKCLCSFFEEFGKEIEVLARHKNESTPTRMKFDGQLQAVLYARDNMYNLDFFQVKCEDCGTTFDPTMGQTCKCVEKK
jgi:hypothetical protein